MAHPRRMLFLNRMYNGKESNGGSNGRSIGCNCGYCLVGGCSCTDTGSHSDCLCDRCGDGGDADWQHRKETYE